MGLSCSVCPIFGIILFLHFLPGSSASYFNCDPVNQAHYCLCSQTEPGVWDIQCPARIMEIYPISIKLSISPDEPEEASLRVICDPNKSHFGWRLVQGLNFEDDNVTFSVTAVEISYCPAIPTRELQNFYHQMKLDPEGVHSFSFQSWKQNTTLPSDFLSFMPNLETVDLSCCNLDTFPSFGDLDLLSRLDLRKNRLTTIPFDAFTRNHNLQEIRLGGNELSALSRPVFPDSLVLLDLVDNHIKTVTNESLANLKNCKFLYLNNNPLERVDRGAFVHLKNLTELSLDNSKLFTLPLLKNLPKLTNLSISFSLFTSTQLITTTTFTPDTGDEGRTEGMENTNFFTSTILADDSLGMTTTGSSHSDTNEEKEKEAISENREGMAQERMDVELEQKANENENNELIGDLVSLKKLILINDDLKSLNWLGFLPNLNELILQRNELQELPEGFFKSMPSISIVDLSKNALTELNELDAPTMSYLDLSNNFLRIIDSKNFIQLSQLRVLLLASNKVEYVHPNAFKSLENLVMLDLSYNFISFELGPPVMMSRQTMRYSDAMMMTTTMPTTMTVDLDSTGGYLEDIQQNGQSPLQWLKKVERIILKNNAIRKIFSDWTFVSKNLRSLDLSFNKIKAVHPRDLYFVSPDVRFDLRNNELADVDMDFADLLLDPLENKNVVVLLDGNPLHCDCHAVSFKKFSVKAYRLQYSDLRCASPITLKGRKFSEVDPKDLRCMLTLACPSGCRCWEAPSEGIIKTECEDKTFLTSSRNAILRNFTETYEPQEFEIDLSGRNLSHIDRSEVQGISQQFRLVKLTNNQLTSIEFLDGLSPENNVTLFALSQNPFKCDGDEGCKFQSLWWKHFKRISDIRNVTCFIAEGNCSGDLKVLTFQDIVKSQLCSEVAVSTQEVRFLIVFVAILIPVLIATIICITKLRAGQNVRNKNVRRSASVFGTLGAQTRVCSQNPRSKVADMDNSKF